MKAVLSSFAALASFFATHVAAENYDVQLTRKDKNLYKVDGKEMLIRTKYCYTYAYSEDSVLRWSGYGGEVVFLESSDKCEVKGVFGALRQDAGKYVVTVSHEDDDWYEVFGTNTFIQTSACLSLALSEEAFLDLNASGIGRLTFDNGDECAVEGVYSRLRL
jgi:hypothetical protein